MPLPRSLRVQPCRCAMLLCGAAVVCVSTIESLGALLCLRLDRGCGGRHVAMMADTQQLSDTICRQSCCPLRTHPPGFGLNGPLPRSVCCLSAIRDTLLRDDCICICAFACHGPFFEITQRMHARGHAQTGKSNASLLLLKGGVSVPLHSADSWCAVSAGSLRLHCRNAAWSLV